MELRLEFSGDVVERQELLNGTQSVSIEGSDTSGAWSLGGDFGWNRGLIDHHDDGQLALSRDDGAEIFAEIVQTDVTRPGDVDLVADHRFRIKYEIDDGSGAFEGASGSAHADGVLAGDTFRGVWTLEIRLP
jgi:hypothetical protein